MQPRFKVLSLSIMTAIGLTACGGSASSSDDNGNKQTEVKVNTSIAATDAYGNPVTAGIACLDADLSNTCDENEVKGEIADGKATLEFVVLNDANENASFLALTSSDDLTGSFLVLSKDGSQKYSRRATGRIGDLPASLDVNIMTTAATNCSFDSSCSTSYDGAVEYMAEVIGSTVEKLNDFTKNPAERAFFGSFEANKRHVTPDDVTSGTFRDAVKDIANAQEKGKTRQEIEDYFKANGSFTDIDTSDTKVDGGNKNNPDKNHNTDQDDDIPEINAQFIYEADVLDAGTFNFMPKVADPDLKFEWDFGDLSKSSEMTPVHKFAENGIYEVKLIITNKNGETFNHAQNIEINNILKYEPSKEIKVTLDGNVLTYDATERTQNGKYGIKVYFDNGAASSEIIGSEKYRYEGNYEVTYKVFDADENVIDEGLIGTFHVDDSATSIERVNAVKTQINAKNGIGSKIYRGDFWLDKGDGEQYYYSYFTPDSSPRIFDYPLSENASESSADGKTFDGHFVVESYVGFPNTESFKAYVRAPARGLVRDTPSELIFNAGTNMGVLCSQDSECAEDYDSAVNYLADKLCTTKEDFLAQELSSADADLFYILYKNNGGKDLDLTPFKSNKLDCAVKEINDAKKLGMALNQMSYWYAEHESFDGMAEAAAQNQKTSFDDLEITVIPNSYPARLKARVVSPHDTDGDEIRYCWRVVHSNLYKLALNHGEPDALDEKIVPPSVLYKDPRLFCTSEPELVFDTERLISSYNMWGYSNDSYYEISPTELPFKKEKENYYITAVVQDKFSSTTITKTYESTPCEECESENKAVFTYENVTEDRVVGVATYEFKPKFFEKGFSYEWYFSYGNEIKTGSTAQQSIPVDGRCGWKVDLKATAPDGTTYISSDSLEGCNGNGGLDVQFPYGGRYAY